MNTLKDTYLPLSDSDTLSSPDPSASRHLATAQAWVFDLDNTLYSASKNLFGQINVRMKEYIARLLDIGHDEAYRVQKQYFREHGTTLRGLMDNHRIDPHEFLDFVHDVDLAVIGPDATLDAALSGLSGRKLVFTNADAVYAGRVLERLGIAHHFEAIFDIIQADFTPKPDPAVYQQLVDLYRLDPMVTVMVEDMARNLKPAADMGMTTVWVHTDTPWGQEGSEAPHVHYRVDKGLGLWLTDLLAV